jgi:glyoxylase-like metal-dependent hydrolase (beta-lactamase superfamily II)
VQVVEDRHAWERAGTFEVLPGVHRIPLPLPNDGLKAVNVYAIADGEQVVLIDAGWALAGAQDVLARGLATIGYELRDIREFLVTHMHRDHYTQAVTLRRTFGNRIALGEGERVSLEAILTGRSDRGLDDLRVCGAGALADELSAAHLDVDLTDWEFPDRWLPDGLDLPLQTRSLRVIATPGHTRGHVVYHDPQHGALFAGDHVLPHITPSIAVEPNRPHSPLRNYLASLQLIRALPDARLLPAHGPVTDSVHDRIEQLLAHHDQRFTDTAHAVDAGASTAFEVASALPWTRRKTRFADLDLFNRVLAVHETMAHLRVLVDRGWLTETVEDDVSRFARI